MKYVSEYREPALIEELLSAIAQTVTRSWTLMEVCGGQTHTIVKEGLDQLLPAEITLLHGPGCPVCVTDMTIIDRALQLARQPEIIFCSYGDMLRVPGTDCDLLNIRAQGGDVRMVYSPLDALSIAEQNPDKQVVFFAVGFETTVPASAIAIYQAQQRQVENFSMLVAHVLVPPAMEMILASEDCQVQGFLAAGHVCTVTGYEGYRAIARRYGVPIVVTGFEAVDILQGVYHCVQQLERGEATVDNQYARAVRTEGNHLAQQLTAQIFEPDSQCWRGLGSIEKSGLRLRARYQAYDAAIRFSSLLSDGDTSVEQLDKDSICISGQVLQGHRKPEDCPAFGTLCRPETPLGAPMVSSEGACAAYYRYRLKGASPISA